MAYHGIKMYKVLIQHGWFRCEYLDFLVQRSFYQKRIGEVGEPLDSGQGIPGRAPSLAKAKVDVAGSHDSWRVIVMFVPHVVNPTQKTLDLNPADKKEIVLQIKPINFISFPAFAQARSLWSQEQTRCRDVKRAKSCTAIHK